VVLLSFRCCLRTGCEQNVAAQPEQLGLPCATRNVADVLECFIQNLESNLRLSAPRLSGCQPAEHEPTHVSEIDAARLFDSSLDLRHRGLQLSQARQRAAPPEPRIKSVQADVMLPR